MSDMCKLSGTQINSLFTSGQLSATEIANAFLEKIKMEDGLVCAFLEIFDDVMHQAELLDNKKRNGDELGTMAAVPISIKDMISMKGRRLSCASKILENFVSPYDATAITHLRSADCLFIGKVNMDEFGMGTAGNFSAYQTTKNPWCLNCYAGGSSSGSAASVAARFCPLSLGSDTGGSVRVPASWCGLFGFKPSYGKISRHGLVAFSSSLDQIGLLSHHPEDLVSLLREVSKKCNYDSTWRGHKNVKIHDKLKGLKIGLCKSSLDNITSSTYSLFRDTCKNLESAGASFVDIDLTDLRMSLTAYLSISYAESSSNLARYDGSGFGARIKSSSFEEMVLNSRSQLLGPEVKKRIVMGTYLLSCASKSPYYKTALDLCFYISHIYKEAFKKCDVIILPTTSGSAPVIKADGEFEYTSDMEVTDMYTSSVNLAGNTAISIPLNVPKGQMPIGFQLIGPKMSDFSVINLATEIDKTFNLSKNVPHIS